MERKTGSIDVFRCWLDGDNNSTKCIRKIRGTISLWCCEWGQTEWRERNWWRGEKKVINWSGRLPTLRRKRRWTWCSRVAPNLAQYCLRTRSELTTHWANVVITQGIAQGVSNIRPRAQTILGQDRPKFCYPGLSVEKGISGGWSIIKRTSSEL